MKNTLPNSINWGLLIIRVGLGIIFMIHGFPKVMGGPATWTWLGSAMGLIGIGFAPVFWGFCAAAAEFFGGIGLVLGVFTRISALALTCVMAMATVMHVTKGDTFGIVAHPLSLMMVFIGLIFTGAGWYSVDAWWHKKHNS